jgi:hypothetical protein
MHKLSKFITISVLVMGSLWAASTPARGIVLTQSFTYATVDTDWIHTANIAQFNLFATLNNVSIVETVDFEAFISGTNLSESADVTVSRDQQDLTVSDNISGQIINSTIGYHAAGIVIDPGAGHIFGDYASTNSFSYNYGPGSNSQFVGNGVFPLVVSTFTENNLTTSGGGEFQDIQGTRAGLQVLVIYDYTNLQTVPEPSVAVLFGLGLIGWGVRGYLGRRG